MTIKNAQGEEIRLSISGYSYNRRKQSARALAASVKAALPENTTTAEEKAVISTYFETVARKYGLLQEFRAGGIC